VLSFVAGLWAALSARGIPLGGRGMVTVAGTMMLLGSALWAWRRQQARAAGASSASRAAVPCSIVARKVQLAIPEGLDGEQVLAAARGRFMGLQAAWDARDMPTLQNLTTPEMLAELVHVLAARGASPSRTDVITLHAELLGLEELSAAYLASVEFSGLIRESAEQGAVPFRELWMLACTKDGAPSWRLARQQALL
jgi:predicted lipid-binding transport protein (Tim44 family)